MILRSPAGTSYPRKKGHVDGPSNSFRETGEHLDARNSVQKESVTGPTTQYAYDISRYTASAVAALARPGGTLRKWSRK